LAEALDRINSLATHSAHVFTSPLGPFDQEGETFWLPRYVFVGESAAEEAWRVAIYAGLDGTDARSTLAVLRTLERFVLEPALGDSFNLVFYPLINPSGWRDGTRRTRAGHLLSEQNWLRSPAPNCACSNATRAPCNSTACSWCGRRPTLTTCTAGCAAFPGRAIFSTPSGARHQQGRLPAVQVSGALGAERRRLTRRDRSAHAGGGLAGTPFEASLLVPATLPVNGPNKPSRTPCGVFLNNWRTSVATGQNI